MSIANRIRQIIEGRKPNPNKPEKLPILDISYKATRDYVDDFSWVTVGTAFIWELQFPDDPEAGSFYFYVDTHIPFKNLKSPQRHMKNLTAVWMSGGGIIEAKDEAGLDKWSALLSRSEIGGQIHDPYGGIVSNKYTKDVTFKAEEEKNKVRDISVDNREVFIREFMEEAALTIKSARLRYVTGMDPNRIAQMIPQSDIIQTFDRYKKILDMAELEEEEPESEEENSEDFGPELEDLTGPSEEELANIEAGEEKEPLEKEAKEILRLESRVLNTEISRRRPVREFKRIIREYKEMCPTCDGFGYLYCKECNYTGKVWDEDGSASNCPKCKGHGRYECIACKGTGTKGNIETGIYNEDEEAKNFSRQKPVQRVTRLDKMDKLERKISRLKDAEDM